mgnify:CR=1 FL=1
MGIAIPYKEDLVKELAKSCVLVEPEFAILSTFAIPTILYFGEPLSETHLYSK